MMKIKKKLTDYNQTVDVTVEYWLFRTKAKGIPQLNGNKNGSPRYVKKFLQALSAIQDRYVVNSVSPKHCTDYTL